MARTTKSKKKRKNKDKLKAGLLDGDRKTLIRRLESLTNPKQYNYGSPENQKAIDAIRAQLKRV
mgnify:FL=1|tara:strand:- start:271 stop:462 length:192 start_codon:yes stop_codon:yes gene_type:complete